ncbi:Embryonic stem cell-specific 5-hydroxymethylcytosine-binding protein [Actinidia chinensis var. chinensis]|uniref:Embryonic stem cell-specific 5-hydroxymethylcytosine-binding protein n=1 Tax=Actinidia chinensis var. chinensis TaxID=1590841 RepID=A0A2R6P6S6_ACTCC|nr:Embryonic stem cell-specific 5-hydroxymethylcytosine-binding protein [Actinidia chinensis var. chinensis]
MCGRARCTLRADDIPRACRLNGRSLRSVDMDRYRPSYNVAPGRDMPVVRRDDGSGGDGAVLHCMKWGLIPSFTKKSEKPDHYKMFNARSESICEKASFRRLVPNSRCLVVVEGFYEWKKDGSKKQPYYIHYKDGRSLVFAALYDSWKNSEGEILYTFTIVTTSSSSTLEWLHERMPVILGDKESTDTWLFGSTSSKFETVLKPYEETDLVWYPVTPAMGKPSFDEPECIKEIKLKMEETKPISKFFSKKGLNSGQGSSLGSSDKEVVKTNQPKSLKEEPPETEDSVDHPSVVDKPNNESKPNVSTHCCEGVANLPIKRDYEDISADTKPSIGKGDKPRTSPLRKKGNLGAAGDKQPTLFSYFGKK